jgi:hypothetical protein
MTKRVLVFGLPGSGKTEFSKRLKARLTNAVHLNADEVRKAANDWDFTPEGRLRQARRMRSLADNSGADVAILDFVCPKATYREIIQADLVVWMNTIDKGRYEDTNTIFEKPLGGDYIEINAFDYDGVIGEIIKQIGAFDWRKPTAQMMGRFQPFHEGHKRLFIESFQRVGQVAIMVRDTYQTSPKDPFTFEEVEKFINEALENFKGHYVILRVPNVTQIHYGRDVGYGIEKIDLPPEIEAISATDIRKAILTNL